MAIDITITDHRSRLARAMRRSFTDASECRKIRNNLYDIYRDADNPAFNISGDDSAELGTLVNLFQKFVRGHLLTLAYFAPKWDIKARTTVGRGLDSRMNSFMNRYTELIDFNDSQKQLALDSAFGWAVCKVNNGIAPKGIAAEVAPRVHRINPDLLIVDPTAPTVEECSYIGDIYLVPLNEAKTHPGFVPELAAKISEYRDNSDGTGKLPDGTSATENYAEPMTRLVDIYIRKAGKVYTWECPNDNFDHISSSPPLGERESKINPYTILSLLNMPGNLLEISRLRSLRGLHLLANEMLNKGVQQARASQRNPVGSMGASESMGAALSAGDNNPFYVENLKTDLGLYTIPGPDPSILTLGAQAAAMFSKEAGNLEVALGASAGADTARQTEALMGQISAAQSIDRQSFEEFLSKIGQKVMTLAFDNDTIELMSQERIPGTQIEYNRLWAGPSKMPRVTAVDNFHFSVTPFSTAFRTPQERVAQLNQATQLLLQLMMAKMQGAPLALGPIINSVAESFDLVPELLEWWSGQEPDAMERTMNTYQSMAEGAQGSDIRYQGQGQQQQQDAYAQPQTQGGIT